MLGTVQHVTSADEAPEDARPGAPDAKVDAPWLETPAAYGITEVQASKIRPNWFCLRPSAQTFVRVTEVTLIRPTAAPAAERLAFIDLADGTTISAPASTWFFARYPLWDAATPAQDLRNG